MNTNSIHSNTDTYTTRNVRGTTASEPSTIQNDLIIEVTQIIRTLVYYYTENISQHNRIIETYNQNVTTLVSLLNNILEIYSMRNRQTEHRDYNYYRNLFQSRREGANNNRNRAVSLDLSNLVYLLNIPIQATVANNSIERPIPLTLTEIANATQIIYYNESMGERRCPISLDDFIPNEQICQIRGCRHFFKPQHLLRWLESHVECPVCRYDLRQYRATASSPTNTNNTASQNLHTVEQEIIDLPTIDTSMNLISENTSPSFNTSINTQNESAQSVRRNISVSEFLPILDNILSPSTSTNFSSYLESNGNQNRLRNSETNTTSNLSNLLNNRFSQLLSDIILEQIPSIDSSNNLLYTIEIPINR